ncbi:MAG: type II secretion system F family protein [Oligoflexia bacterium]|nr:type II secretion system F family protein [Bdellovibrionales bacterium]MYE07162.1 type II secretion system F family protein [Oligoflexia bacterium]
MEFGYVFLFSGLGLGALSVYLFCSVIFAKKNDAESLAWAEGNEPTPSKMPLIQLSRPLVHNLALKHVQNIKSPKYRQSVEHKITTAGISKELNTDEFIGLQILWGLMFPLFFVIMNFALQLNYPYWLSVVIGLFGMYFPHLYCSGHKKRRQVSISTELPFFIDLLALSTEAGLDFFGAIQKITEKAKNSPLADEFLVVQKDIKLGSSRQEALSNLAKRMDIDEITSVCTMIIDSDETGASIAKTLKAKSEQMRYERFARAEKEGAKASQKMLLPMIFFILPAVMLTIFSPIGLQFLYRGGS